MRDCTYEEQLDKIFSYIRLSGVPLSRNSTLGALKLIEDILATDSSDFFERVMSEVLENIMVSEVSQPLPLICPQVNRSSIGYRDE